MLLGEIWITGKLVFSLYKDIIFGDGPIIKIKLSTKGINLVMIVGFYLMGWSLLWK